MQTSLTIRPSAAHTESAGAEENAERTPVTATRITATRVTVGTPLLALSTLLAPLNALQAGPADRDRRAAA